MSKNDVDQPAEDPQEITNLSFDLEEGVRQAIVALKSGMSSGKVEYDITLTGKLTNKGTVLDTINLEGPSEPTPHNWNAMQTRPDGESTPTPLKGGSEK